MIPAGYFADTTPEAKDFEQRVTKITTLEFDCQTTFASRCQTLPDAVGTLASMYSVTSKMALSYRSFVTRRCRPHHLHIDAHDREIIA